MTLCWSSRESLLSFLAQLQIISWHRDIVRQCVRMRCSGMVKKSLRSKSETGAAACKGRTPYIRRGEKGLESTMKSKWRKSGQREL